MGKCHSLMATKPPTKDYLWLIPFISGSSLTPVTIPNHLDDPWDRSSELLGLLNHRSSGDVLEQALQPLHDLAVFIGKKRAMCVGIFVHGLL